MEQVVDNAIPIGRDVNFAKLRALCYEHPAGFRLVRTHPDALRKCEELLPLVHTERDCVGPMPLASRTSLGGLQERLQQRILPAHDTAPPRLPILSEHSERGC